MLEHRKVSVKVRTKNIEEMKNKWEKGNYEIGVMIRKKEGIVAEQRKASVYAGAFFTPKIILYV